MSAQNTVKPSDRLIFDDTLSLLNASQEYYDLNLRELGENDRSGVLFWARNHLNRSIVVTSHIVYLYNQTHAYENPQPWVEFLMDPVTHVWSYNIEPYDQDRERK